MRHRLYAALALALALALSIAAGSFARSSLDVLGPSAQSTAASLALPDDDRGDVAATSVTPPLLVGLFVALAVFALAFAPARCADVCEARRARAPPAR